MSQLNLKFFDDNSNSWGVRVPQHAKQAAVPKSFAFACVNFGSFNWNPMKDGDRCMGLSELIVPTLKTKEPIAFAAILDVTTSMYDALMAQQWVRRNFAITDLHPTKHTVAIIGGEGTVEKDMGAIFLVRHGIWVEFTESLSKQLGGYAGNRPLTVMHMRNFLGSNCRFVACSLDPSMDVGKKADHIQNILQKIDPADTTIIASNFYQQGNNTLSAAARSDIVMVKESLQFAEANELCAEPSAAVREMESSLWVRVANKLVPTAAHPLAPNKDVGEMLFRSGSVVSFVPRGAGAAGSPPGSGFSIPQPRSAMKEPTPTNNKKGSDSPASPTPMFADPAVVSAQEGGKEASSFPAAPLPRSKKAAMEAGRWQSHNMIMLRGQQKHLNADEVSYDLTSKFGSVREALEALRSGSLQWSADYLIVGGVILAAEGAASDFKGFKRYVANNPPPRVITGESPQMHVTQLLGNAKKVPGPPVDVGEGMNAEGAAQAQQQTNAASANTTPAPQSTAAATTNVPNAATAASTNVAATTASNPQQRMLQRVAAPPVMRPRYWSDACTTLVFQVTPIEMKFDITHLVGVMRGSLRTALARLNQKQMVAPGTKPDPLQEWGYDYCLLYAPEKQGYWLISAADVPCDILACRQAAVGFA